MRPREPAPRYPSASRHIAIAPPVDGAKRVRIGATEATVAEFGACLRAGACKSTPFLADAGLPCNYGIPGREDHPMNCVDFMGASAFCKFDRGRLCTASEWFAACRGREDRDYPYGPGYDASACLARPSGPTQEQGTAAAGSRGACRSSSGVYDMAGNVSEWVDDCKGKYCHFYGGAYLTNEPVDLFASCKQVCAGNENTLRSSTVGIRCCYDE